MTIPLHMYEEMLLHCIDQLPNEGCGLLGGRGGEVELLYKMDNEAASPNYYRPDNRQMLAAMTDMEGRGIELIGIFHSHVRSEAYPSLTDVREAHYLDPAYVIVTLADLSAPKVRAFRISKDDWRDEQGKIAEIDLMVS